MFKELPMGTFMERAEAVIAGKAVLAPIAQTLGFRLVEAERGRAVIEMDVDERHMSPLGLLHGGVLCDVGDAAMGAAYFSALEDGETFTTLELKINFLKPIWQGRLTAEGRLVKAGRTIGLTECDITDERGSLVAKLTSTCMTLRGEQAKGR